MKEYNEFIKNLNTKVNDVKESINNMPSKHDGELSHKADMLTGVEKLLELINITNPIDILSDNDIKNDIIKSSKISGDETCTICTGAFEYRVEHNADTKEFVIVFDDEDFATCETFESAIDKTISEIDIRKDTITEYF